MFGEVPTYIIPFRVLKILKYEGLILYSFFDIFEKFPVAYGHMTMKMKRKLSDGDMMTMMMMTIT